MMKEIKLLGKTQKVQIFKIILDTSRPEYQMKADNEDFHSVNEKVKYYMYSYIYYIYNHV